MPTLMGAPEALRSALPLGDLPLSTFILEDTADPLSFLGERQSLDDLYLRGATSVGGHNFLPESPTAFRLPLQDGVLFTGEDLPLPHDNGSASGLQRGTPYRLPPGDEALLIREGLLHDGSPSGSGVRQRGTAGQAGGRTRRRQRGSAPPQAGQPRAAARSADACPSDARPRRRLRRRGHPDASKAVGRRAAGEVREERDRSPFARGQGSNPMSVGEARETHALAAVASSLLLEGGEVPLWGRSRRGNAPGMRGGDAVRRLIEREEEVPETDNAFGGSGSLGGGEEGGEGGRPSRCLRLTIQI
jgi:hypothetical protein